MADLLLSAAKRLGVTTEVSAGPGSGVHAGSIWASWPRHPHEIAQDVLNHIIRTEVDASVTPVGGAPLWRARHGQWTHIGRFEDAVAHLASHVAQTASVRVPTMNASDDARATASGHGAGGTRSGSLR